jgi:hypothetical protein
VIESKPRFELWKEYFNDLLRETARAYAQGATQEEAGERVEQWLVAKYADQFYPRSFRTGTSQKTKS